MKVRDRQKTTDKTVNESALQNSAVSATTYCESVEGEITELEEGVKEIINKHYPTEKNSEDPIVCFNEIDETTPDTLYASFITDPEATLQLLAAVTGIPIKTAGRECDIPSLHTVAECDILPHKDSRVSNVVPFYQNHLPEKLPLSAILQTVTYRWIDEYRRSRRQNFESNILTELEQNGIPTISGNQLEGKPDIAIPDETDAPTIVGEVRIMSYDQIKIRFDEFKTEVNTLANIYPNANIVVVFGCFEELSMDKYIDHIQKLKHQTPDRLHDVYYQTQLDKLVTDLKEIAPVTQASLSSYTHEQQ